MEQKMHDLNQTPKSDRLHIAIFGKRNAGKSSLINAITGQQTAIVSDTAGTTADPVYKTMELSPLGPCVLIDTAGAFSALCGSKKRAKSSRLRTLPYWYLRIQILRLKLSGFRC